MIIAYLRKLLRHVAACVACRHRDQATETGTAQRLETALATLPELQRDVYLLHARNGMSLSDIAAHLDLSSIEAEQYLATALANLDRQFGTISASGVLARRSPAD